MKPRALTHYQRGKLKTPIRITWTQCYRTCPGWGHFTSNLGDKIERCDECDRFPDDAAAVLAHRRECGCDFPTSQQGGFSNAVFSDPGLQDYLQDKPVFGWIGHFARTDDRDRAIENALRDMGWTPEQIAEWVCSRAGRHLGDWAHGKGAATFRLRLPSFIAEWQRASASRLAALGRADLKRACRVAASNKLVGHEISPDDIELVDGAPVEYLDGTAWVTFRIKVSPAEFMRHTPRLRDLASGKVSAAEVSRHGPKA